MDKTTIYTIEVSWPDGRLLNGMEFTTNSLKAANEKAKKLDSALGTAMVITVKKITTTIEVQRVVKRRKPQKRESESYLQRGAAE